MNTETHEPTQPIPASYFRRLWVCRLAEKDPENYVSAAWTECTPEKTSCAPIHLCGYYWRASFTDDNFRRLQRQLERKNAK